MYSVGFILIDVCACQDGLTTRANKDTTTLSERKALVSGAMEEMSRKVQNASAHPLRTDKQATVRTSSGAMEEMSRKV